LRDDGLWHALILKSTYAGITWLTNPPVLDLPEPSLVCVWILPAISTP